MKKLAIVIVPLVLLAIAVSAYSIPAIQASSGQYSVSDLKGDYAFSADGMMYPNFPDLSSASWVSAVGVFSFDGAGSCTVHDRLNVGPFGPVPATGFRTSTTCTYNVNPDGTGALQVSFGGAPGEFDGPGNLTFAIMGKEIRFIRSDPGLVAKGMAQRQ
jgi:hypothetical protein